MKYPRWLLLFGVMFLSVFVAGWVILGSPGWAMVVVAIYFFGGGVFLILGDLLQRNKT